MLAHILVPKHFSEESTPFLKHVCYEPFLKHACYEQCLLLKYRAQWEASCPGALYCVQDLVEGRRGTLSECRVTDCVT